MSDSVQVLAQQLSAAITNLQQVLSTHHGLLRGTFEAALAEAQGAELIAPNARTYQHLLSMEQAVSSIVESEQRATQLLGRIRLADPRAAGQFSSALREILQMARSRIDLAARTRDLIFEIESTGNAARLGGLPAQAGAREAGRMMSQQVPNLIRGGLVPSGLQVIPWVQRTLDEIRRLPMSVQAAAAQATAAAAMARATLQAALARAAAGGALEVIGNALLRIWSIAGRLITVPIIIIPVDENGRPLGMPGGPPQSA